MSAHQFTSGPWEAVDGIQVWGGEPTSHDGRGYPLAECCGPRDWVVRRGLRVLDLPEREANARLIAAAPELYEALELMIADFGDYPASERPCLAFDKAHAALAKARGAQ